MSFRVERRRLRSWCGAAPIGAVRAGVCAWLALASVVGSLAAAAQVADSGVARFTSLPPERMEVGAPSVVHVVPGRSEGEVGIQFWAIEQHPDGRLLFGTGNGVIEYDRITWRIVPTANGSTVRSLAVARDGTVFVGAQGEVGFLSIDGVGRTRFESLMRFVPDGEAAFSDVWKTYVRDDGVFFQTYEKVLFWDGSKMTVAGPSGSLGGSAAVGGSRFHFSFLVHDDLFVLERGRGLLRWRDGGLELVPMGEFFADDRIYAALPYEDGRLLIATRDRGLFLYDERGVVPFPTEIDDRLAAAQVYCGLRLWDGSYAFGTRTRGLLVIDARGNLLQSIDRRSGLPSDSVLALFADDGGALWLGLEKRVARVGLPSAFSVLGETEGLDGLPQHVLRHEGRLYVSTTAGVFRLRQRPQRSTAAGASHFDRVQGVDDQAWTLATVGERLLVASLSGVFEIDGLEARPIYSGRASYLLPSKGAPERVFVSLFDGLASLRLEGDRWVDEGRWPQVQADVRSLAEDEAGDLWAGTAYGGVYRLDLDLDRSDPASTAFYDASRGLPRGDHCWIIETSLGPRVGTPQGMYRYDAANDRFVPDATYGAQFARGDLSVSMGIEDEEGDVWIVTGDGLGVARAQGDGGYRWSRTPFEAIAADPVLEIRPEANGVVWLGVPDGLVRYDPRVRAPSRALKSPLLRRVGHPTGEAIAWGSVPRRSGDAPPEIDHRRSAVRFDFSAPSLPAEELFAFETRLVGFEDDWYFSPEPHRTYTNLPSGDYEFQVRIRDHDGRVGPEATYAFLVTTPWYRTIWALLAALAVLAALGLRFHRWMTRRTQRRVRAEAENDRRRDELETARRLQNRLLPAALPEIPYLDIAVHQQTATEVGGDYYDLFPQPDGGVIVVLGDATGHGIAAGLMVTATKAALLTTRADHLGDGLQEINSVLYRIGLERRLHMALGVLRLAPVGGEPERGLSVRLSGGGIPPVYLLRRASGRAEEVVLRGLPLGAMERPEYPMLERTLEHGDALVLMSDGLPESVSPAGELLGYERLGVEMHGLAQRFAAPGAALGADDLLASLRQVAEGWSSSDGERADDLTILVLCLTRPAGR